MNETDNIVVRPDGEGSVLRTDKLVKRYGKRTVANGVSINVRQGEIVGLLGPNGAGKTTLLRIISGLWVPTRAQRLEVLGADLLKPLPRKSPSSGVNSWALPVIQASCLAC